MATEAVGGGGNTVGSDGELVNFGPVELLAVDETVAAVVVVVVTLDCGLTCPSSSEA